MELTGTIPNEDVAYVIRDKFFPDFSVRKGKGAWWNDQSKVVALITIFKAGGNVTDACSYAGISKEQWQYFNEQHPEFYGVKSICQNLQSVRALQLVDRDMEDRKDEKTGKVTKEGNVKTAKWWLTKRNRFFAPRGIIAEDESDVVVPVPVAINEAEDGERSSEVANAIRELVERVGTGRK